MKSVLIVLAAVLAVSLAGDSTFKCPQPYLSTLKPVALKNFLGVWYIVRSSPCDEEHENAACISQSLWRTKDTPANVVNSVCSSQLNGTWEYNQGSATVKPGTVDGEVEPQWQWQMGNTTVDAVFVESDNGQHWGIGHSCFEDKNGNLTSVWAVFSRCRKVDAKLEQVLVEKIEKYSGITQDKMRGVRQTGCYELDHKEWV